MANGGVMGQPHIANVVHPFVQPHLRLGLQGLLSGCSGLIWQGGQEMKWPSH